jgi:acylphosphatase
MTEVSSHAGHDGDSSPAPVRLTARVTGRVQGVGFRAWTRFRAAERGLVGSAKNAADGSVQVVAEGREPDCRALLEALRGGAAPGRVAEVTEEWSPARGGLSGFAEL